MSSSNHPAPPPIATPTPSNPYKPDLPPPYTEFFTPAGPSGPVQSAQSSSIPTGIVAQHPHYVQGPYPQQQVPSFSGPQHPNGPGMYGSLHPQAGGPMPSRTANYHYHNPPPTALPPGHHHQFGPTPLNDTQALLPYAFYNEGSAVNTRARWRFFEAWLCAIAIYIGFALLVGVGEFGDFWMLRVVANPALHAFR
ncbi:hypothetical protein FA15DRAFT_318195 [Coprinopsis marcescibilis]|uniref:Uncharacterized protein n=1 Tax=Coprinopsis marcescibilis TaxID=230819 RepID=A0A5C3KZS7_COPMA|nr:hypothetical protein FA15DRAFT_318195 [Coprinopsis marcescibilis]